MTSYRVEFDRDSPTRSHLSMLGCESWKARMEKLPGNHIDEIINPRADQKKLMGNRILWKMDWSWEFWWLSHHRNSCLQLSRLSLKSLNIFLLTLNSWNFYLHRLINVKGLAYLVEKGKNCQRDLATVGIVFPLSPSSSLKYIGTKSPERQNNQFQVLAT